MTRKLVGVALILAFLAFNPGLAQAAEDIYIKNGTIADTANFGASDDIKKISSLSSGQKRLFDYANGYSVDFPGDMWVDASLSKVRVVLANESTQVEIYHDVFYNTINNSSDYIGYGNRFLERQDDYPLAMEKTIKVDGMQTHLLQWSRAKLNSPNDRNNYLSAELVKSEQEVYTIFIKSTGDPSEYLPLVKSFRLIDQQGEPRINTRFKQTNRVSRLNAETQQFYQEYFSDQASLKWGIYMEPVIRGFGPLNTLEDQIGSPFHILVWYKTLGTPLPRELLDNAYKQKKYLELTFQTEVYGADNSRVMYDILNGKYDAYLNDYARSLKGFGHPILFRMNNEMNGDWCTWSSWRTCKDTDIYKAVWRHVYRIFEANGVDNVLWVWNPNDLNLPGFQWNHNLMYFPGSEYVDIVGMTGYNTGTHFEGEKWRSFNAIYQPLYNEYVQNFDYPFMITEFSCSSIGGDKVQWINDMFSQLKQYPKIKVANWFSGIDMDAAGQPGRIYTLNENPACVEAFSKGLKATGQLKAVGYSGASPYFQTNFSNLF